MSEQFYTHKKNPCEITVGHIPQQMQHFPFSAPVVIEQDTSGKTADRTWFPLTLMAIFDFIRANFRSIWDSLRSQDA